MTKSKKIIFRINPELHDFIIQFSKYKGMTPSEMCRNIINYWFMAYFTGDLELQYDKLKEKFICIMNQYENGEQVNSSQM